MSSTTHQVQPRLGIAYQVDPKTVVRAGGGEFVTRMGLLDNIFPGGNSPFQPFVTVSNVSVDNPGAALTRDVNAPSPSPHWRTEPEAPDGVELELHRRARASAELGFVRGLRGARGLHNGRVFDINQPPPGALQANPGKNVNYLRPYKGYAAIQQEQSNGNSMYNSMQVSWNRRFTAGSLFGVSYTWSKSMDNSSNYRDIVPDTYNTNNLWGPSEYDTRHIVIINYLYDLPFFKGQNNLAGRLLGGWQLSGSTQFQTGNPAASEPTTITPVSANSAASAAAPILRRPILGQEWNSALCSSNSPNGSVRQNTSPPPIRMDHRSLLLRPPAPSTCNPASATRSMGPASRIGTSICVKSSPLARNRFEFRAEAYNFINHPNWAQIGQRAAGTSSDLYPFGEVTRSRPLTRVPSRSRSVTFSSSRSRATPRAGASSLLRKATTDGKETYRPTSQRFVPWERSSPPTAPLLHAASALYLLSANPSS